MSKTPKTRTEKRLDKLESLIAAMDDKLAAMDSGLDKMNQLETRMRTNAEGLMHRHDIIDKKLRRYEAMLKEPPALIPRRPSIGEMLAARRAKRAGG